MFKYFFQIFIVLFLFTSSLKSEEFNNILINGNERISDETILIFSNLSNEQFLNENSINDVLKKLYESGFFKDVVVKIENKNLIIDVVENPIIETVFIEGINRKTMEESLYGILSLKNRSSFNRNSSKEDVEVILSFLKNEGFYFSEVTSSYEDLGNNKINLFYNINLGEKAKISKISFIGDKKFKDRLLRDIIVTEEYKFWKFISGKKFLNENLIKLDENLLKNFYKNKGFYDVKVISAVANYIGDSEFELIYNINAGKKYYFNELKLALPIDYDVNDFTKLNSLLIDLKGKNYSLNTISKILNEIDKIVTNKRYEFLTSSVQEYFVDDLINLTFNIKESDKFYIEKINIYGNNITEERVLREIFLIDEGDALNELLFAKSINNLKALNFFKNVKSKVTEGTDQGKKILNITVEEKPTGEISAGAGVGTSGSKVSFGIKENNFLGRGIRFGSDIIMGTESVKGIISLNNPNYKGTDRSLNFSAESIVVDRKKNYGYESSRTGFLIGTGYEMYEDTIFNMGVSSYVESLDTDSTASASLKKQKGSYFDTFFNYSFNYDKRDQKFKPTEGFISKFTQNVPLISESYSLTNTYDLKFYNQWLNENIVSYGIFASATNSLTGKDVKLSERLYLPENKLRGFESGKIGPKDGTDFVGGNYALSFNAATTLPQILPSLENADFSLFFDAANIWGLDYSSSIDDSNKIRSSVGLAIDFFTPIGPVNFSFSQPITKNKNDITESFRFNLGTTF